MLRSLKRHPARQLLVILTLALGLGATTSIVSAMRGVLLAPLPFPNAERLVSVGEGENDGHPSTVGFATYADWKPSLRSFSDMAAVANGNATLLGGNDPEQIFLLRVTHNTFGMFGVKPRLGRDFNANDDIRGGPIRIILSDELWKRRFNGDRGIVGRVLRISDIPMEVIGVMPPRTRILEGEWRGQPADAWITLRYNTTLSYSCRGCRHLRVFGRLRDGVTIDQATREAETFTAGLRKAYPNDYSSKSYVAVQSLHDMIVGRQVTSSLWIVFAVAVMVLLAAVSNAAGLRLSELFIRQKEIVVRQSLGATPARLATMLIAESLIQASLASLLGFGIAVAGIRWLRAHSAEFLPRAMDLAIDPAVVATCIAIALLSGALIGWIPAWRARNWATRAEGRGIVSSRAATLRILVGVNVALSVVLLAGSALLLRSVRNLFSTPPGFQATNVVSFRIALGSNRHNDYAVQLALHERFMTQATQLPGVQSIAMSSQVPFAENNDNASMTREEDRNQPNGDAPDAQRFAISPGYFDTLRVPILRGRAFNAADRTKSEPVLILNQTAARVLFGNGDALGRRVQIGGGDDNPFRRVVGVVPDIQPGDLGAPAMAQAYLPLTQFGDASEETVVARTTGDVMELRELLRRIDPDVAVYKINKLDSLVTASEARRTFILTCIAAFSAVAVALAMIGVYGMLSLMVSSRTRELGLRLALGSTNAGVFRFVVAQALRVVVFALFVGVMASLFLGRLLQSLLYGVANGDPMTIATVIALLATATFIAAAPPAVRAARVSPMRALHEE
ncbi:MAG TPA: ABC transporter permease [Thermoanaerobaculia bacterium]|nr:ABC transporter permease [Thermoanaerobaculia bacterium]